MDPTFRPRENVWGKHYIVHTRIFLENNNKIQTISLVRKRFKLIWFLTTRVQRGRFLGYKIEYVLLDFPILPVPKVGPICRKLSSCHSFCKTRKRVQWTRFLFLQTEFIELNFHTYKSSSMNSVSILANRVHWTRFVLKETTILVRYVHRRHHSKKHFRHTKKPNTQKKLSSNFKHTVTLSHSLSLSQLSSLSLLHSHSEPVAPSLAPSPTALVAVAASRFRRRRWRWMF